MIPHTVLAAAAFLLFFELARFDQGYATVLYWIGFIVAPVITIFGGAAWGSRRLYGYPDLGPHPSRAALVAVAVLAGVLVGLEQKHSDIQKTEQAVKTWVEAGEKGTPPRTHLGFLAPPDPIKGLDEDGADVWGFPVGNDRWRLHPELSNFSAKAG